MSDTTTHIRYDVNGVPTADNIDEQGTSTYTYTAGGELTSVFVRDGEERNVLFRNDINGQALRREEVRHGSDSDNEAREFADAFYRYGGTELGRIGGSLADLETSYTSSVPRRQDEETRVRKGFDHGFRPITTFYKG